MKGFTLIVQDTTHSERIEGVVSFVGEDASGSFGILAGHARMMSILVVGLARYRRSNAPWQNLIMPSGALYFCDDVRTVGTRHFLQDSDYTPVSARPSGSSCWPRRRGCGAPG